MAESAAESVRRSSSFRCFGSGSAKLDGLLGGGYRAGTLTEFYGKSNSGKSQIAMQAALIAARDGRNALFVDTEGSFRPERLEQMAKARGWEMGGVLEKIVYVRSDSMAEQMETVRRMGARTKTAASELVVIDTLTRNFSVELPGRPNLAVRQEALAVHLSEMARDAYINGRAYVLTNRVTFGQNSEVSIGGRTVEDMVGACVRLEKSSGKTRATIVSTGISALMESGEIGVA